MFHTAVIHTPKRLDIMELLNLTMVTAHILVAGGIVQGKRKSFIHDLRSAQKYLRSLRKAGYVGFFSYPTKIGRQKYYHKLSETPELPYHEIQQSLITHDSITALFLTHLFRVSRKYGISLRWYPPFPIGDKQSDGGIALFNRKKLLCSLLLETDTGSHDHHEIREKLEAYVPCLTEQPHRRIVFLTAGEQRKKNIYQTIHDYLQSKKIQERILCLTPANFPKDMDLFTAYPLFFPHISRDLPCDGQVTSEGTHQNENSLADTSIRLTGISEKKKAVASPF